MSAIQKKKVYQDFSKGLNDRLSAIKISENEATELINCALNDRGILEKYKGFIRDSSPFPNDPDSFIRFLLNFKRGTTVDVLLMAALDEAETTPMQVTLKKTTGDGSYSTIQAGLWHKDFVPRGVVFNNFAIMTNGSEDVQKYDNSSLTSIAAAPKGKFIETHKNRVFIASTSSNPSTIYWSAVNDETVWDAAAFEPVYPEDNGNIISIKSFADSLIVLKNNGNIYQVVGSFDQDDVGSPNFIRRVDSFENIGIISERTPVVHNGLLYFIAETGLYSLDRSMGISKVTYNIPNLIKSLNFSLAPTTDKNFTFNSQAQWTAGGNIFDGTRALDGTLKNYFDLFTVSDAEQGMGRCSVAIDPSNNVHLAYVDATDNFKITYKKYLATDNSVTTETAVNEGSGEIKTVSLDIANNGNIGIGYRWNTTGTTHKIKFVERTTSWQASEIVFDTHANISTSNGLSLRYATNDPRMAYAFNNGVGQGRLFYSRRILGSWGTEQEAATAGVWTHCSLELEGNDPRISAHELNSGEFLLRQSNSAGDTGTWTTLDTVTGTGFTDYDHLQLNLNSTNQPITVWSNGLAVKKRNHATATTTTINSDNGVRVRGYRIYTDADAGSDKDYYYTLSFPSGPGTSKDKFTFETSSTIENSVTNVLGTSSFPIRPGDRGMHNNDRVFVVATFGGNANEIIVRRVSFRGEWDSDNNTDTSFSSWKTYEVSGLLENSGTVTQEIGTKNGGAPVYPTDYRTVTSGVLVDSDNTKDNVKNKITFVLGSFASPEIGSIVDNYRGAGVDAKQMVGISFDNELFYAVSRITDLANSFTLIQDIAGSYLKVEYPVSALERFKGKLYAGKSTNGDLLVLKQGYNFDGSSYTSDIQVKEDFLETIELEKDIYKMYVLFEVKQTGSFDFSYRLDSFVSVGGATWQTTNVDQTKDGIAEIPVKDAKARTLQMRVQNSGLDEQLGIVAVVIVFGDLAIR